MRGVRAFLILATLTVAASAAAQPVKIRVGHGVAVERGLPSYGTEQGLAAKIVEHVVRVDRVDRCEPERDVGNGLGVEADAGPLHGEPCSALVTLPPLGVVWLVPLEV